MLIPSHSQDRNIYFFIANLEYDHGNDDGYLTPEHGIREYVNNKDGWK